MRWPQQRRLNKRRLTKSRVENRERQVYREASREDSREGSRDDYRCCSVEYS